ncbi:MAG: hypothetical protein AAB422_00990, partial [Planctomycetota bacterium]
SANNLLNATAYPPRVSQPDGSDASRRAIGAADCHPLLFWRFAPVHQAAAAGSRPREQARVYVSRCSAAPMPEESPCKY